MKTALAVLALLSPRAASACAVCFGGLDNQSGVAAGFWWAIVLLLAVTMSLVGGIGYTLWTVERRRAERGA